MSFRKSKRLNNLSRKDHQLKLTTIRGTSASLRNTPPGCFLLQNKRIKLRWLESKLTSEGTNSTCLQYRRLYSLSLHSLAPCLRSIWILGSVLASKVEFLSRMYSRLRQSSLRQQQL